MKQNVVVKGNIQKGAKGFTLTMDKDIPFEELLKEIGDKFEELRDFFKENKMVVTLKGREVTGEEEQAILKTITDHSDIHILYVTEEDEKKDAEYEQTLKNQENSTPAAGAAESSFPVTNSCYKGTLRSGQLIQSENSVVIVGDVNPGGKVESCGNIIILGSLKGIACAGLGGNRNAFVAALEMMPMQIQIDNIVAKGYDRTRVESKLKKKKKKEENYAKIAILKDENIYIENICKDAY